MNLHLTKRESLIIIGTFLLSSVIVFSFYWFFYQPVAKEREHVENEIKVENKLISALESKMEEIEQSTFENTSSLQKKVPVKPFEQKLLIDLEKAEVISGSMIKSIEFTDGEVSLPLTSTTAEEDIESTNNAADESAVNKTETVEVLPSGLKKLTATLSVDTENYFELEKFIAQLERMDRIVEVEQIAFTGPKEIRSYEDGDETISFILVISTFYLPDLIELAEELPKFDSPEPANKKDPFHRFPNKNNE
jgi:type IV pilus assembly protein PilO